VSHAQRVNTLLMPLPVAHLVPRELTLLIWRRPARTVRRVSTQARLKQPLAVPLVLVASTQHRRHPLAPIAPRANTRAMVPKVVPTAEVAIMHRLAHPSVPNATEALTRVPSLERVEIALQVSTLKVPPVLARTVQLAKYLRASGPPAAPTALAARTRPLEMALAPTAPLVNTQATLPVHARSVALVTLLKAPSQAPVLSAAVATTLLAMPQRLASNAMVEPTLVTLPVSALTALVVGSVSVGNHLAETAMRVSSHPP